MQRQKITSLDPIALFSSDGFKSGPSYRCVGKIATGGFGTIFIGCLVNDPDESPVAIKELELSNIRYGVPSETIREVSLLKELDHENIVRLLYVTIKPRQFSLIFEYLPMDLLDYMADASIVKTDRTLKNFMRQILSAVAYCHSHKIIHRDLKPANVLVDTKKNIVKLCDFGLARDFGVPLASYTKETGTLYFRAPEVLFDKGQYTISMDVWAVGCIFAWMKTGEILFRTKEKDELSGIFSVLGTPTEETWPGVTKLSGYRTFPKYEAPVGLAKKLRRVEPLCIDLISRMVCLDPNQRISADGALTHKYFKEDEWQRMVCLDPSRRISAAEALHHEYFKVDEYLLDNPSI